MIRAQIKKNHIIHTMVGNITHNIIDEIAKHIDARKGGLPVMKQGALYPVLRSLENSGLLESEVEPSVAGPPRRYYRITEAGRETLKQWEQIWHQTRTFVDNALKGIQNV